MTSYYWQPVPLAQPLLAPLSSNATTYGDILARVFPAHNNVTMHIQELQLNATNISNIPNLVSDADLDENTNKSTSETLIPLLDRGWCDIALGGSVFEPFNVSRWEIVSVEHYRDELLRNEKEMSLLVAQLQSSEATQTTEETKTVEKNGKALQPIVDDTYETGKRRWQELFLFPTLGRKTHSSAPTQSALAAEDDDSTATTPSSPLPPSPLPIAEVIGSAATPQHDIVPVPSRKFDLPWYQREYDLKPYGFGVVVDLSWSRKTKE